MRGAHLLFYSSDMEEFFQNPFEKKFFFVISELIEVYKNFYHFKIQKNGVLKSVSVERKTDSVFNCIFSKSPMFYTTITTPAIAMSQHTR